MARMERSRRLVVRECRRTDSVSKIDAGRPGSRMMMSKDLVKMKSSWNQAVNVLYVKAISEMQLGRV